MSNSTWDWILGLSLAYLVLNYLLGISREKRRIEREKKFPKKTGIDRAA
jgi:hypothetical protein